MNDELVTIYVNDNNEDIAIIIHEYPDYVVYTSIERLLFLAGNGLFTNKDLDESRSFLLFTENIYLLKNAIGNFMYSIFMDFYERSIILYKSLFGIDVLVEKIELPIEVGYEIYNKLEEIVLSINKGELQHE